LIWLVVGVLAAYQRHYLANSDTSCAKASTIAVTVLAGPLNYAGINRKVKNCKVPQPSRKSTWLTSSAAADERSATPQATSRSTRLT